MVPWCHRFTSDGLTYVLLVWYGGHSHRRNKLTLVQGISQRLHAKKRLGRYLRKLQLALGHINNFVNCDSA